MIRMYKSFYGLLLCGFLAAALLPGCSGCGGGGGGGGGGSVSALTPSDLGWIIPETDPENVTVLSTGEEISAELISISVKEGVSKEAVESIAVAIGGSIAGELPDLRVYYLKFSPPRSGTEIKSIVEQLRSNSNVETASPEYIYEMTGLFPSVTDIETPGLLADDQKWGFNKIRAPQAWQVIRNSGKDLANVVVAVIDTGLDLTHPDLQNNVVLELNGYKAMDFGDNDTDVSYDTLALCLKGDHGTSVSGIIASTINGEGINGVAPTAKIFPLKIWPSIWKTSWRCGEGKKKTSAYTIASAVAWAVLAKADVINLSLGAFQDPNEYKQTVEYRVIKKALENNIVVVAGAGNDGKDSSTFFPAAVDGVISVGATDINDERSIWGTKSSNWSDSPTALWVAAPGTDIYTTDIQTLYNYEKSDGTSIAAPFVSGLAALLRQIDPSLSNTQIANILRNTADDINVTYPDGSLHAWKRINAENAVKAVLGIPSYSISGRVTDSLGASLSGVTMTLSGAASDTKSTDASGNYTFTGLANGSYTVTPSKTGYTFTPSSRAVTVNNADVTGQDFVGTVVAAVTTWAKTYGGSGFDFVGQSIQQTSDGGYIVAGSFGDGADSWVLKLDSNGGLQWQKAYGGPSGDSAGSIQRTSDGGYIVAGNTGSFGAGGASDFWVLKLESTGGLQWQKAYGGPNLDLADSIQQTSDGGYIVAGDAGSFGAGDYDFWVLKLDSNGGPQWQKAYGGASYDDFNSIQQTSDGGYIVAGSTGSFGAGGDAWVLKLDLNGGLQWQKAVGGSYDDRATSIQQTSDGGYIFAGLTSSSFGAVGDFWVLKLDANGGPQWQKAYGGLSYDYATSIQQTSDGGYIVAGDAGSFGAGGDFWVLKLDSTGGLQWQKAYGGLSYDYATSIQQTSDGGYIVAGYTGSFGAGYSDFWILKLTSDGTINFNPTSGATSTVTTATVTDTTATVTTTSATVTTTSVTPGDTNATVTDTNATVTQQAP